MKRKLAYLNVVLTVIAVALTVIILQNAHVIEPVQASPPPSQGVVDVNIWGIGGWKVMNDELPVAVKSWDAYDVVMIQNTLE